MDKKTRICALALAVMLFAAILFSCTFMAVRAEHDCARGDCFVCHLVALCENTLRAVSCAVLTAAAVMSLRRILCRVCAAAPLLRGKKSLIALKVKLSD